ncbi:MAG: right-handed parallel beta-helix repeat-containing protein [Eubacteriales bacterium]|nr:right-handed parallel beta-helix repeat-containing protein [Eubacteriales bacterium]
MRKLFLINFVMALIIIVAFSVHTGKPVTVAVSDSYFVSTAGSDRNPGTEKEPWATIQKAAESAVPGSTVYIKAGTYSERIDIKVSGTSAEESIVFRNHGSDLVIIDGSGSAAPEQEDIIHISSQNFIRIIGLEITGNTSGEEDCLISGIGIWGKGEGIQIKDCKIHHIWYTGSSEEAGAQAIAVYGRDGKEPISGLVIDGNEIWDIKSGSSESVVLNGNVEGFEFTNNYVHDTNAIGLALLGDELLGSEPVCPVAAKNRARNGFVGYNTMERNSRAANPSYPKDENSGGGICADGAKNVTIANNRCMGNDIGIEVENETRNRVCTGIVVRGNLLYGNKSCGIAAGGQEADRGWAENCKFLNNTLYNNDTRNQGRGEIHIAKSRNLQFRSNVVYTGPQNLAVTTEAFGENDIYNISFDHNLYYGPGGSRGLRFAGNDTGLVGLNMWKNKTGQDKNSRIKDPRFVDAAKGDFGLQQYSPAIDFGDPAYVPEDGETDLGGMPRISGKAIDCGAYEL